MIETLTKMIQRDPKDHMHRLNRGIQYSNHKHDGTDDDSEPNKKKRKVGIHTLNDISKDLGEISRFLEPRASLRIFDIHEKIGGMDLSSSNQLCGGSGVVYRVTLNRQVKLPRRFAFLTDMSFAMKVPYPIIGIRDVREELFERGRLPNHRNICRQLAFFEGKATKRTLPNWTLDYEPDLFHEESVFIIYPLARENLKSLIKKRKDRSIRSNQDALFGEEEFFHFAYDILSGARHLYLHEIVHRNLKPDNILVFDREDVTSKQREVNLVIADFGTKMDCKDGFIVKNDGDLEFGSPHYTPPESKPKGIGKAEEYFDLSKGDVYSVGLILYEMITGSNVAFSKTGNFVGFRGREFADRKMLWLVENMLKVDADERIGVVEAHQIVRNLIQRKYKTNLPT